MLEPLRVDSFGCNRRRRSAPWSTSQARYVIFQPATTIGGRPSSFSSSISWNPALKKDSASSTLLIKWYTAPQGSSKGDSTLCSRAAGMWIPFSTRRWTTREQLASSTLLLPRDRESISRGEKIPSASCLSRSRRFFRPLTYLVLQRVVHLSHASGLSRIAQSALSSIDADLEQSHLRQRLLPFFRQLCLLE